jgi:hypothetical protein
MSNATQNQGAKYAAIALTLKIASLMRLAHLITPAKWP